MTVAAGRNEAGVILPAPSGAGEMLTTVGSTTMGEIWFVSRW